MNNELITISDPMPSEEIQGYRNRITQLTNENGICYQKFYKDEESRKREQLAISLITRNAYRDFLIPNIVSQDDNSITLTEVGGEQIGSIDLTSDTMDSLGKALRSLHSIPVTLADGIDVSTTAEQVNEYLEAIKASKLVPDDVKDLSIRAAELIINDAKESQDTVLVHGDCNANNILFDPTKNKVGFIDFERSGLSKAEDDLARAIWRICKHDPKLSDQLLRSYYGRIPNQADYERIKASLVKDYFGAIAYYAWEGWTKDYPFYDEAAQRLAQIL